MLKRKTVWGFFLGLISLNLFGMYKNSNFDSLELNRHKMIISQALSSGNSVNKNSYQCLQMKVRTDSNNNTSIPNGNSNSHSASRNQPTQIHRPSYQSRMARESLNRQRAVAINVLSKTLQKIKTFYKSEQYQLKQPALGLAESRKTLVEMHEAKLQKDTALLEEYFMYLSAEKQTQLIESYKKEIRGIKNNELKPAIKEVCKYEDQYENAIRKKAEILDALVSAEDNFAKIQAKLNVKEKERKLFEKLFDKAEKLRKITKQKELEREEQLRKVQENNLNRLLAAYDDKVQENLKADNLSEVDILHEQALHERVAAAEKVCNQNLQKQCKTYKYDMPNINSDFINTFEINKKDLIILEDATELQNQLLCDFKYTLRETADIYEKNANNKEAKQFIEYNVESIKQGIAYNKANDITKASHFADVSWILLEHLTAITEAVKETPIEEIKSISQNITRVFSGLYYIVRHPIETGKTLLGYGKKFNDIGVSLTGEIVEYIILLPTNPKAAAEKMQNWQAKISELDEALGRQWDQLTGPEKTKAITKFCLKWFSSSAKYKLFGRLFKLAKRSQVATNVVQKTKKVIKAIETTKPGNLVLKGAKKTKEAGKRIFNTITKADFFQRADIKRDYEFFKKIGKRVYYRRKKASKGLLKKADFISWDHTHNDVEVYKKFRNGMRHLGSYDPVNNCMYKPPVPARDVYW